jgi:hypothetical protein
MLQQLQSRYLMEKVRTIRYGTERGLVPSSRAFLDGSWKEGRLYLAYANGLEVYVNGNPEKPWRLTLENTEYALPPFGWLARHGKDFFTASSLVGGRRADRVSSPQYVFLDGRGSHQELDGIGTSGSVAVQSRRDGPGLTIFAIDGVDSLSLSAGKAGQSVSDARSRITAVAQSRALSVEAFDIDGKGVGNRRLDRPSGPGTAKWGIPIFPAAIRYEVTPTP